MDKIIRYFPRIDALQQEQFGELGRLYGEWNAQINVVSRQDIDFLYERHILHSLAIAKVISFKPGTTILDVGTGGGFPGIPLAIMFPEARFLLVDSIGKKIKVVREVAQALSLTNVEAQQIRADKVDDDFEFVVSRAVTRLKPFTEWVKGKISRNSFHELKNGILYLKGGDITEELHELNRKARIFTLSDYFDEAFFETKKLVHIPL